MEQAAPGLSEGQVWLQTSTVGLHAFPSLVQLATAYGLILVDAPVLGTRQPAEEGKLQVFVAGPEQARDVAKPVLEAIAAQTRWLDVTAERATATRLKLVVNNWVLAVTTAVGECLSLAEGLGIDPALFPQVISGGGLDSPYLQTKAAMIIKRDLAPSFATAVAAKDARLILEAASDAGVTLDVADAVLRRFERAITLGHADEDMAATFFASFSRA
jgi:3-hydroxyisobutyrate dehydrogenase